MPRSNASRTLQLVMTPSRSLSPRGFVVMMWLIGVVSFVAGMVFVAMGAWPVTGFFGLDVLLVYLAFKLNYRDGRLTEVVELTADELTLTRRHPDGREEREALNPYWVRVVLDEAHDGGTTLSLQSHGRRIRLGAFLSDDERREVAGALSQGLAEVRG